MNLEIKIIKGNDVLNFYKDPDFIPKWKDLASHQKSLSVHQEYPFVSTWYRHYSNKFTPVLVIGYNINSEIIGLIFLAENTNDNSLTHAGAWQAEYKGWICEENFSETFPVQALIAIKNHFNLKKWDWGWTPPRSNSNWLHSKSLKKEGVYIKLNRQDSPLLNVLDEDKLAKLLKSRSIRTKINRYKKRGDFYIERITSKEKAKQVFDILEKQSDFRHLAIHNVAPFGDDPNKKPYHIDRLDFKNSNHFTVLWSNDKPIAFNFGECDNEFVILGLTSYDPTEGKNSPGKIFLIKLAEFIKEEGFKYFDLTPGGDTYKDWFSNDSNVLFNPIIYFNKRDYIISKTKSYSKKILKNLLIKLKLKPEAISNINSNKGSNQKNEETFVYYHLELNNYKVKEKSNTSIQKNNFADLLLYSDTWNKNNKSAILARALRQFTSDDILFSFTSENKLVYYGWMTARLKNKNLPNLDFNFLDQSIVLYDFFFNSKFSNSESLTEIIDKMLNECKYRNMINTYICAPQNDPSFIKTIEDIGFVKIKN